jgi:uncharacterized protein (TIGR02186 family)
MIRLLSLLLALMTGPALAEESIVLGLSQDEIAITASFNGSEILVFGAIKRDAPVAADAGPLGVIITVSGPLRPVTVRRKERRFGIWINSESVDVDLAPTFYAVATSGPFESLLSNVEDLRHTVSIPRAIRSVGAEVVGTENFTEALIRIRSGKELYQVLEGAVDLDQDTLFHTEIDLPANLTEGDYAARILLTRGGAVVDEFVTDIPVNKIGLERWLYELAHDRAPLYGLLALFIAISAGWGASAAFGLLLRR